MRKFDEISAVPRTLSPCSGRKIAESWFDAETAGASRELFTSRFAQAGIGAHTQRRRRWNGEPLVNPLNKSALQKIQRADKSALAPNVVELWDRSTDLPLDLGKKIRGMVRFICEANEA